MIEWIIIAAVCIYAMSLARRLAVALEELRIERRLRWQAEQHNAQLEERRRRLAELNWRLIQERTAHNDVIYIDQNGHIHD